jgi:hypothetical protein
MPTPTPATLAGIAAALDKLFAFIGPFDYNPDGIEYPDQDPSAYGQSLFHLLMWNWTGSNGPRNSGGLPDSLLNWSSEQELTGGLSDLRARFAEFTRLMFRITRVEAGSTTTQVKTAYGFDTPRVGERVVVVPFNLFDAGPQNGAAYISFTGIDGSVRTVAAVSALDPVSATQTVTLDAALPTPPAINSFLVAFSPGLGGSGGGSGSGGGDGTLTEGERLLVAQAVRGALVDGASAGNLLAIDATGHVSAVVDMESAEALALAVNGDTGATTPEVVEAAVAPLSTAVGAVKAKTDLLPAAAPGAATGLARTQDVQTSVTVSGGFLPSDRDTLDGIAGDYQRRGDPVTLPPAPAGYGGSGQQIVRGVIRVAEADGTPVERLDYVAGDTGPALLVQLQDEAGAPVDLTGADVTFHLRESLADAPLSPAGVLTVVSPAQGLIRYDWGGTDLSTPGKYKARFRRTLGAQKATSAFFWVIVDEAP